MASGLQFVRQRALASVLVGTMLVAVGVTSCGGSTGAIPGQPPPAPWSPAPNDFRFQGVGADMSTLNHENGGFGAGGGYVITPAWGGPIELGNGSCAGNTIDTWEWAFHDFVYLAGLSRDTTAGYESDYLTDLAKFPNITHLGNDLSAPGLVVHSLDVQPGNDAFAIAWISSPSVTGFEPSLHHIQLSDLTAFAATEGLKGRVITALSLDSPTTCYVISYGWAKDTNPAYETSVKAVTRDTVGSVAKSMASQGYVITAFGAGGQPNFGWYMVGTRFEGSTTPRPIFVSSPYLPSDALYFEQGYSLVVSIYDVPTLATATRIWIVEK